MSKKIGKLEVEAKKLQKQAKKYAQEARESAELVGGALSSIHAGADMGRSYLTASEWKRLAPTRLDKMEVRLLKMLVGWSITDIECLLVDRVVPEAKRRAKVPK